MYCEAPHQNVPVPQKPSKYVQYAVEQATGVWNQSIGFPGTTSNLNAVNAEKP